LILLDEKSARRIAAERGMRITGTLGILGEAAARGIVDLPTAIDRLRGTNFRCSPVLLKATLDRFTAP
jgi:predicted nucleic acid-binding protein